MTDTGFSTYQAYMAMGLHFNPSVPYDYFTYNGKTNAKNETFRKSKWKWQFAALESKVDNAMAFLYHAFKLNDFSFLHQKQLFALTANKNLESFGETYINGLKQSISKDLDYLIDRYEEPISFVETMPGNLYPNIHEEYDEGNIELETALCVHLFFDDFYDEEASDDIVAWPAVCRLSRAVAPFVAQLVSRKWFLNELNTRVA